ncbi:hypothetical protein JOM56_009572 [Amanita muscaria]
MIQSYASNNWDHDLRWTAGFYQLHEPALIKELDSASAVSLALATTLVSAPAGRPTRSNTQGVRKSKQIKKNAKSELERLQALPLTSHKWIWGTDLTLKDILNMVKASKKMSKVHSGYVESLPGVNLSGETSDTSMPPNHGEQSVSSLAPDNMNVPETFVESMCATPVFIHKSSISRSQVLFSNGDSAVDTELADDSHIGQSLNATKVVWTTADIDAESAENPHAPLPQTMSFEATKTAWKTALVDTDSADDSHTGAPQQTTSFAASKAAWKVANSNAESADDMFAATKAAWKAAEIDDSADAPAVRSHDADADGPDTSASSDHSEDEHQHKLTTAFDHVAMAYRNLDITSSADADDSHSSQRSPSGSLRGTEGEPRLTPNPYDQHYFDFFDESWLPDIDATAENMHVDEEQDEEGHFI